MKGVHAETKRILNTLKKNETSTFVTTVNVTTEFKRVVDELTLSISSGAGPYYLLLVAQTGENVVSFATLAPDAKWAEHISTTLQKTPGITVDAEYQVTFSDICAQTAFKGVDMILALGSAYLKAENLVTEEPEEHEYGFDDI
jgi:hypothetical protein